MKTKTPNKILSIAITSWILAFVNLFMYLYDSFKPIPPGAINSGGYSNSFCYLWIAISLTIIYQEFERLERRVNGEDIEPDKVISNKLLYTYYVLVLGLLVGIYLIVQR